MSGPKVVNLEAVRRRRQRESLVGIRKLRDAIETWEKAMKEAGLLTDAARSEAETILARMENLRNSEQWDALFVELPAREAFFRNGSASAQQVSIDRLASLRERGRRVRLSIEMLKRELQCIGEPLPPELQSEPEETSDDAKLLR